MCFVNPIYNAGKQEENFAFENLDWEDAIENDDEDLSQNNSQEEISLEKA